MFLDMSNPLNLYLSTGVRPPSDCMKRTFN
jgi:hypothetical protein